MTFHYKKGVLINTRVREHKEFVATVTPPCQCSPPYLSFSISSTSLIHGGRNFILHRLRIKKPLPRPKAPNSPPPSIPPSKPRIPAKPEEAPNLHRLLRSTAQGIGIRTTTTASIAGRRGGGRGWDLLRFRNAHCAERRGGGEADLGRSIGGEIGQEGIGALHLLGRRCHVHLWHQLHGRPRRLLPILLADGCAFPQFQFSFIQEFEFCLVIDWIGSPISYLMTISRVVSVLGRRGSNHWDVWHICSLRWCCCESFNENYYE